MLIESEGVPLSFDVDEKLRLSKDRTALKVNPSPTLAGIPPEMFNYRLGNHTPWIGSSTSAASPRTNAAGYPLAGRSAPTRTGPTIANTSSAWSVRWSTSAWRR